MRYLFVFAFLFALSAHAIDYGEMEKAMAADGAVGWIHGDVPASQLFAFTYRNPANFFDYGIVSLIPANADVEAKMAAAGRQDRVRIKGAFADNPSPQKHAIVTSFETVTAYVNPYSPPAYHHQAELPKDLLGLESAQFLVHAVGGDGRILVTEWKDAVVPIYVVNGALTSGLARNDIVRLRFRVRTAPPQPTHLALDETRADAVQVVQSIRSLDGQPANLEGALVMFPKSPEINFDVFALDDPTYPEQRRQFTLLNNQNAGVFQKIRAKLKAGWDARPKDFVNGRNKLISTCLRVRAKGTFSDVDPNQANAQILLASADDLEVIDGCHSASPSPGR